MGFLFQKEREVIEAKAAEAAELAVQRERRAGEMRAKRLERQLAAEKVKRQEAVRIRDTEVAAARLALKETAAQVAMKDRQLAARNGCPPELSEALIDELCQNLERYLFREACELCALSPVKLQSWRAKAGSPGAHPLLVELNRRVSLSIAKGNAAAFDAVLKAAQPLLGEEIRLDGAGRERKREVLLQRADPKVLLEIARARMPALSPRSIIPVEEEKLEDEVNFREIMSHEEFEAHLAGEEAREKALERAASNEMLVRMNERSRLPPVDTTSEDVVESSDDLSS